VAVVFASFVDNDRGVSGCDGTTGSDVYCEDVRTDQSTRS